MNLGSQGEPALFLLLPLLLIFRKVLHRCLQGADTVQEGTSALLVEGRGGWREEKAEVWRTSQRRRLWADRGGGQWSGRAGKTWLQGVSLPPKAEAHQLMSLHTVASCQ